MLAARETARPFAKAATAAPLVCHVITTLETGGAQMMLYKLLASGSGTLRHAVVSLGPEEAMAPRLRALGFDVHSLGMARNGSNAPVCFLALVRLLRRLNPALVQTWMHHADLTGGLAARLAGVRRIVWGIRHSDLDPSVTKARTVRIARLCGVLSRWIPQQILCCSEASRATHAQYGYRTAKMVVIPNGFDTSMFRPSLEVRAEVRTELRVAPDAELIGLFARYHPMKDHPTFLRAAGDLCRSRPGATLVLCGDGVESGNSVLRKEIQAAELTGRVRLLGRRGDIARLTAALDIAVSSSVSGEGFSNTIGEAMSSGVVCVVTDVGDSAAIVGDTGLVVPPGRPDLLSGALQALIEAGPQERARRGVLARQRIVQYFSLSQVTARYEALYQDLLEEGAA